jgi:hypothetical protein
MPEMTPISASAPATAATIAGTCCGRSSNRGQSAGHDSLRYQSAPTATVPNKIVMTTEAAKEPPKRGSICITRLCPMPGRFELTGAPSSRATRPAHPHQRRHQ